MMGDARRPDAPSDCWLWKGTVTATATWGLLAGANLNIQSCVSPFGRPVRAVPGLTAARRYEGKIPAAVAFGTKNKIRKKRKPAE